MDLELLKKEDKLKLQQFYLKNFEKDKFIDEELLSFVSQLSYKYNVEFVVVLTRRGKLVSISAGDFKSAEISITQNSNSLSGIRVIHTHPNASCKLSKPDESALLQNKLDAICAVSVTEHGLIDGEVGFINGESVDKVYLPNANYINKYGLLEKLYEYDKLYRKNLESTFSNEHKIEKGVLVKVLLGTKGNIEEDLNELESLANTAGIVSVGRVSQKRVKPDVRFFIGEGKLEELKQIIQIEEADVVVFDNELSGSRQKNLSNVLGVKVIDRSMLILDIFAQKARSAEGKLQVELAHLKYSLPRLGALANGADRFGGVGMRGPGESKLELNRRVIEKNIKKLSDQLKELKRKRDLNRKDRMKNSKTTVAIVGYTNSGKSTLMNKLARANVYEKDELFATLDTTTRNVWLGGNKEILLTDTVGFVKNLPHEFIEAFSSTLEESVYCDLLINVVDASNPNYMEQQEVVLNVLKGLNCTSPVITVYNKIDKIKGDVELPKGENIVHMSAKTGQGIDSLKKEILKFVK